MYPRFFVGFEQVISLLLGMVINELGIKYAGFDMVRISVLDRLMKIL